MPTEYEKSQIYKTELRQENQKAKLNNITFMIPKDIIQNITQMKQQFEKAVKKYGSKPILFKESDKKRTERLKELSKGIEDPISHINFSYKYFENCKNYDKLKTLCKGPIAKFKKLKSTYPGKLQNNKNTELADNIEPDESIRNMKYYIIPEAPDYYKTSYTAHCTSILKTFNDNYWAGYAIAKQFKNEVYSLTNHLIQNNKETKDDHQSNAAFLILTTNLKNTVKKLKTFVQDVDELIKENPKSKRLLRPREKAAMENFDYRVNEYLRKTKELRYKGKYAALPDIISLNEINISLHAAWDSISSIIKLLENSNTNFSDLKQEFLEANILLSGFKEHIQRECHSRENENILSNIRTLISQGSAYGITEYDWLKGNQIHIREYIEGLKEVQYQKLSDEVNGLTCELNETLQKFNIALEKYKKANNFASKSIKFFQITTIIIAALTGFTALSTSLTALVNAKTI